MGRRPNQLILEFFTRGRKLEDASNRYEHTCRRCGEHFPKGRVEALMGHVLRRCPNVTQIARETVFLHLQQTAPARGETDTHIQIGDTTATEVPFVPAIASAPSPHPRAHFHTPDMLSLVQHHSALDTLAEVSRRHRDYSGAQCQPYMFGQEQSGGEDGHALAEQALIEQLQHHTAGAAHSKEMSQTDQKFQLQLSMAPLLPEMEVAVSGPEQPGQADAGGLATSIDPDLGHVGEAVHHLGGPDNQVTDEEVLLWNPTNQSGRQTFGALSAPSIEPTPGFGLLSKKNKTCARGRFTDTRRKEVQEIRKRGACIRCRMLKKPCSEGTPCSTCANVESARLWKGKCLRTRLADEFSLWSSSLFHSKARLEVPAAVQGMNQHALAGHIEVRFFANSDLCMSFAAKRYSNSPDEKQLNVPSGVDDMDELGIWLLDEGDNMCDKIEAYVQQTVDASIEDESSVLVKATVKQAQVLMHEEVGQPHSTASPQQGGRSCYNLQSQLVKNTVELWAATNILIASDELGMELQYAPELAPQQQPQVVSWSAAGSCQVRTLDPSSPSHTLIKSQLLAAVESWCSRLAKGVINELERRLLQRQQVSRVATFISAAILLNAVERMTGLYRTLNNDGDLASGFGFSNWPIDDPPSKQWPQGEHFAELLTMLLRMRALPPKTVATPDGTLAAAQDHALSVQVNSKPVRDATDGQTKLAAGWLDPINLSVSGLVSKRDGPPPERIAGVREGDLRFLSELLLPEKSK